jgi:hypothetical protein
MFDMSSIGYSDKVNAIFRSIPMYAATDIHHRWLWPVKFILEALEGTMASEVSIPDLPHILLGGSRME